MKKVNLLLAAVVAASLAAPAAYAYTPNAYFGGYMRAGVGFDKNGDYNGGDGIAQAVGRLGAESKLFGEVVLGTDIAKIDDTVFTVNSLVAYSTDDTTAWSNASIGLRQFNVEVKGLFESDKDALLWMGKRYVQREDIHAIDKYYYNISGSGFGIENVSLGSGKWSFAYTQPAIDGKKSTTHLFDTRYSFPLWDGATFQIGETYNHRKNKVNGFESEDYDKASADAIKKLQEVKVGDKKEDHSLILGDYLYDATDLTKNPTKLKKEKKFTSFPQKNGNVLTLEFNQGFSGGWNKTVYQWFAGANAKSLDVVAWDSYVGGSAHKIYNFGETSLGGKLHLFHVASFAYQNLSSTNPLLDEHGYSDSKIKTFQVVLRPWYQLTKMTKLIADFGVYGSYKEVKHSGANTHNRLQKATFAYAICPDASSYWSKPELRFFVTWLHGDNTMGKAGINPVVTSGKEDGSKTDITVGAQVEAWW